MTHERLDSYQDATIENVEVIMKTSWALSLITCLCIAAIAGFAAAEETELTSSLQQQRCCFENPRFSGTCEVTPGPEESCSDVLAYLNNPKSVGKNYCGNTKVRGGWTQVSCDDDAGARISCESPGNAD
jgi:hypothetical protein